MTNKQASKQDSRMELLSYLRSSFPGQTDEWYSSELSDRLLPALSAYIAANYVPKGEMVEARIQLATALWLTPSEGLFDGGDLFVKRKPLEQTLINEIGYEAFKAIQEAATAKELQAQKQKEKSDG